MHTRSKVAVAATALGLAVAPAAATGQQAGPPLAEQTFFTAAAASNQFEIQTGRIAADRARQTCVRRFARDLVRDHTRQQAELRTVAAARGVTLPATPPFTAAQTRDLNRVRRASSRAIDDRFLRIQLAAHVTAIRLFQSAATGQPSFTAEDGSSGNDSGNSSGNDGGSAQATSGVGSLPVVLLVVRSLPILGRHYGEADTLRRYGCARGSSNSSNSRNRGNRGNDR